MPEFAVDVIASQPWLKRMSERIQGRVNEVCASSEATRRARSFLEGEWLGTPLHRAVSDIPMGAWTVTAALDACELTSSGFQKGGFRGLTLGADAALHIGLAGAVASAATGWASWSETEGRARSVGLAHGLLEGGAVLLFVGSSVLRGLDRRRMAQGFSFFGYALAATASWLGGKMTGINDAPPEE